MEEKNFPFLFGRSGGAEIEILSTFKESSTFLESEHLLILKKEIENHKSYLIERIYKEISQTESLTNKRFLLSLKRDLFNDREIVKYESKIVKFSFQKSFNDFQKKKNLLKESETIFKNVFYDKFFNSVKGLGKATNEFYFLNGLIFSSQILYDQVRKSNFDFNTLNKKNRKLILSSLRYLTRSTAKTTPFSTFNTIFWSKGEASGRVKKGRQ